MKVVATILIMIWTSVLVQPAFAYFGGRSAYGECSKADRDESDNSASNSSCKKKKLADTGCSKKKCDKSSGSQENDCNKEGCNPSLGCTAGNFYIHHHFQVSLASWFAQKQKVIATDDNRVLKNMSECWHPPEA